jgi:hypothetical protein
MKILLYGEYWPGTHIDCISEVLKEKNINFKIFDFYKYINPKRYNYLFDKVLNKLLYEQNEKLINKLLINEIDYYKPNILFISKGVNIFPETIQIFKNKNIIVVNWNPDDFFNKLNTSKNLLSSLSQFDYVFSARQHLFEEYIDNGIKNPKYVEWYYIPWLHKKHNNQLVVNKVITFIGTYSKRRESILLKIEENFPIEIWGSGWLFSPLRFKKNVTIKNKFLEQKHFPKIISSSLINLNILTKENRDLTNLKIFEITASNGLLLTENNSTSKSILSDNVFYFDFNNTEKLNETIKYIYANSNNTLLENMIANSYHNITMNENSINHRVEQILKTF